MAALGLDPAAIVVTEVQTDEAAHAAGFIGSPTIRIDGEDVQPTPEPAGLTCRVYRLRDGRFSPTPDPADLHDALSQAMKGPDNDRNRRDRTSLRTP
ncbi:MAG: hypothetical protein JWO02_4663 [Solirubrobacterales bacterium]|nr:hypothetical protein [Solirubrobacterales bacterium]